MHSIASIPALALLVGLGAASYTLQTSYPMDSTFFDEFSFFTSADPTNGFVQYVSQTTAQNNGYISASNGQVYIGVDHNNVASSSGRQSVRLTSTASYTHGLFILDLAHMPASICGTWPAFWTVGPSWPNNGEIDIIEGVNQQSTDSMTLHTASGCTINNSGFTGSLSTSNCYVDASGQSSNAGCGIQSTNSQSYGTGFDNVGGGVYAMEWTSSAISIWFFPSGSIPSDITSGSPNPAGWSTPAAYFNGGCDIDSFFNDHQIVFDITFCGDWAGSVWSSGSCASQASSCDTYVQNNPSAFANSYWLINSLDVYQGSSTSSSSGTMYLCTGSTWTGTCQDWSWSAGNCNSFSGTTFNDDVGSLGPSTGTCTLYSDNACATPISAYETVSNPGESSLSTSSIGSYMCSGSLPSAVGSGTVYLCTAQSWTGTCQNWSWNSYTCHSFSGTVFDNALGSAGPSSGSCTFYSGANCDTPVSSVWGVSSPGSGTLSYSSVQSFMCI